MRSPDGEDGLPLELKLTGVVRQSAEVWSLRMEPVAADRVSFAAG